MFRGASKFNQSLETWALANVTSTYAMFHTATSFDGDVSSFDLSNNLNTGFMFYGASSFTGDLSSWVRLSFAPVARSLSPSLVASECLYATFAALLYATNAALMCLRLLLFRICQASPI